MNVDSILKKEGISIVRKLHTLEVTNIAEIISKKLISHFSDFFLDYDELFDSLSSLNMYIADMPLDSASAKYLYVNNSIYFNSDIDLSIAQDSVYAIHECLHFLQTKKNNKGKLLRLGLYEFGHSGTALNEAAVQLMASIAQEQCVDTAKYYDIEINTVSPDCYPLQCALLSEILYFTGNYPLYQSTLNSNDIFKNTFISFSNKKVYKQILESFDYILKFEDDLYYFYTQLTNATSKKDINLLNRLIANRTEVIKKLFFKTQNLIIQSYFTTEFNKISTIKDIHNFQTKLYNFKDVVCTSNDYTYYNEFYCNAVSTLDTLREYIESNGNMQEYRKNNTSLVPVNNSNKFITLFKNILQKLKKLLIINGNTKDKVMKKEDI